MKVTIWSNHCFQKTLFLSIVILLLFQRMRSLFLSYSENFERKLNNKKVITTACNFWRQIARSFQVYGRTKHFCAKSTRKTLFWISGFFSPDQHWRHKLFFFRQFSDRSTKIRAKKQQFLISNISEILSSVELKLHTMFIWFILNTFH